MENFNKKTTSLLNDLNMQEKLLYGALGIVLIFGFFYFFVPKFISPEKISLQGKCDVHVLKEKQSIVGLVLMSSLPGQF